jgi:ATP-binding cassette subfamily B protein
LKELKAINPYLFKYRYYLLGGTVFIVISTFFSILPAQLVREAFDLIAVSIQDIKTADSESEWSEKTAAFRNNMLYYGVLILVLALLRGLFMFFMRQTIIVMSRHIEYDQKNEIYAHYQTLPLSFYRQNNTGDLMARISEDVARVRMFTGPAIMYGINLIVLFIMLISYMFSINATLTWWVLLPLPILSFSIYYVNNKINARSEAIQQSVSNLSTFVQEAFSGIRVAKAFVRENYAAERFVAENDDFWRRSMKLIRVESLFFPLIMGLIGLSTILAVYMGGLQVANGIITNGVIAEFVIYVNLLTWPVTSLGWTISIIQRAEASQKRINEFLQTKTTLISTGEIRTPIEGHFELDQVGLTYPDTGTRALEKVRFTIQPGQTFAIVGATGSGKSTVANLMCRMLDPTEGEIRLDSQPLHAYDLSFLRAHIGYVPQDVFLFSDSIRNNILFGSLGYEEEALQRVIDQAGLRHTIESFPAGLDTMIGERGITLSGGQKQRVSIARALMRSPKVLLLDDCLSAVDTKTEHEILEHLETYTKEVTTVIVSHRLSSVKLADHIVVLDDGKVVEQGTHEALYALGGLYRNLYEKQLEAEQAESKE